jgi:hypothetical protein
MSTLSIGGPSSGISIAFRSGSGLPKKAASLAKIPREATKTKDITGGLPRGVHVHVHEGARVRAGEQLMDGPSNPHDILRVLGEKKCRSTW